MAGVNEHGGLAQRPSGVWWDPDPRKDQRLLAQIVLEYQERDQVREWVEEIGRDWLPRSYWEGYRGATGREGVLQQVRWVYEAMRIRLKCQYREDPCDLAFDGPQRLCLPDEMLRFASGVCIEWALLLATLVSAAGLHPCVVTVSEAACPDPTHALMGFWLVKRARSDFLPWNVLPVHQIAAGWLDFVDVLQIRHMWEFDEARRRGNGYVLTGAREQWKIHSFIDIAAARKEGISPLDHRWTPEAIHEVLRGAGEEDLAMQAAQIVGLVGVAHYADAVQQMEFLTLEILGKLGLAEHSGYPVHRLRCEITALADKLRMPSHVLAQVIRLVFRAHTPFRRDEDWVRLLDALGDFINWYVTRS